MGWHGFIMIERGALSGLSRMAMMSGFYRALGFELHIEVAEPRSPKTECILRHSRAVHAPELRRKRDAEGGRRTARPYRSAGEMRAGMALCLERTETIRDLVRGIALEVFLYDWKVADICAACLTMIGNEMGRMDPKLQLSGPMAKARGAGDAIASSCGNASYDKETLWDGILSDLDDIERGCRDALRLLDGPNAEMVFSENKRRWLGKRRRQ